jgi:hypothetical protein
MLGLNLLGFLTQRAHTFLQKLDRDRDALAASARPRVVEVETPPAPAPVPPPTVPEETAGHWWKRLFTPGSMFGLLVGPLQIPILLINSYLLAATLETILDRPGTIIITGNFWGWERDITDLDLIGALISLAQMITASAIYLVQQERQRCWQLLTLALIALPSLMAYEVGASGWRGQLLEGGAWNGALSSLLALGIAATEAVVGIFLIDRFLIPLLLAGLWSLALPFRGIARWWERRQSQPRRVVQTWQPRRSHPAALAVVYPLAALDVALMAPLRRLDHAVTSLLPGRNHRHTQGVRDYAEPIHVIAAENGHLSRPGSDTARVRKSDR